MRRVLPLILLWSVAVAGCATAGDGHGAAPARLEAWRMPRELFIPRVTAPPPAPAPRRHARRPPAAAHAPAADAGSGVSPGAPSDAEVRAQLRELYGEGAGSGAGSGGSGASAGADPALADRVVLDGGLASAPPDAPAAVQRIVAAANQVARLPYVYGGGHGGSEGLFVDTAYDCSGSVSFALANAGLLDRPLASGALEHWGRPGPGRWVTVYANAGHAFMVVGGARFDTVGLAQTGSRWQRPFRSVQGFVARHPAGL